MNKLIFIAILPLVYLILSNGESGSEPSTSHAETSPVLSKTVKVYDSFEDLAPVFLRQTDTTYIINFWATTCPPCLREMPHFEELETQYENRNIRILLVSLDSKRQLENRVIPFIQKHLIQPEVVLLADDNYSAWTDRVDPSWYGALPATLIVKGDQRNFKFGAYESYRELEDAVLPFL